jgi:hypothetical protein
MKKLLLTWLWFGGMVLCAAAAQDSAVRYPAMLDTHGDLIVQRVVVPSTEQPQGEVQLIRRGNLLVVQTLLASRVLKQVIGAIDGKEQRNWPEARNGHLASLRYRDELFRATEQAWDIFRQRPDHAETRQFLAIEFIYGPDRTLIALSAPVLAGDYGSLHLTAKRPLQVWRSPEQYVRENIVEIVQDSFRLDRPATESLLQPFWPQRTRPGTN